MDNVKRAVTDHPILDTLANRWSPYAFEPRNVEPEKLLSCLEAARWAASSYNEQPWSFIVATRDQPQQFHTMLECLLETNQVWAQHCGVLLLTVVCKTFQRNGTFNRVAEHDVGLAMGNFCCQATHLGLATHQMAGVDLNKARQTYLIPETHEPLTGVALGYAAAPERAPNAQLAKRDQMPRTRKPLSEIVFAGKWQSAADLVRSNREVASLVPGIEDQRSRPQKFLLDGSDPRRAPIADVSQGRLDHFQ